MARRRLDMTDGGLSCGGSQPGSVSQTLLEVPWVNLSITHRFLQI